MNTDTNVIASEISCELSVWGTESLFLCLLYYYFHEAVQNDYSHFQIQVLNEYNIQGELLWGLN